MLSYTLATYKLDRKLWLTKIFLFKFYIKIHISISKIISFILPNHRMLIQPLWIDGHLLYDLDSDSGNYFLRDAFLFVDPCDVVR